MPARPTAPERLAAGLVRMPNGCLEWTGCTSPKGYGRLRIDGKDTRVHRYAWELANGPIPPGMKVLHHCDVPSCAQTEPTEGYPDGHLFVGTDADNMADMAAKGRDSNSVKTHCPANHEFTETNTYLHDGRRLCRTCRRDNNAAYKTKMKNAAHAWLAMTG